MDHLGIDDRFDVECERVYRDGRDDVGREVWHFRIGDRVGSYGPYPTEDEARFAARREVLRLLAMRP